MQVIQRRELQALLQTTGPCASIYLSLNPIGWESQNDPLRVQKAGEEAARQLAQRGFEAKAIEEVLTPLATLPKSPRWPKRGRGMAIFLGTNVARFFSFDEPLAEEVWGDERFHVRPLIPRLVESDRFYLLALSEHFVRLYQGDADQVTPLDVPGLPQSLESALQLEAVDRGSQVHSVNAGGPGRAIFHGHGGKIDTAKEELREFFVHISEMVERYLHDRREPLVLATVAENEPIWRDASKSGRTLGQFVCGSPDHESPSELHRKAWDVIRKRFAEQADRAYANLCDVKGTPRTTVGLTHVLSAAVDGRVDTLFVDCRKAICGKFDRAHRKVEVQHASCASNGCDLVELAIQETLGHGGDVIARTYPEGAPEIVEVLLRY